MEFRIENLVEIEKVFKALELASPSDMTAIRESVKAPISRIERISKGNLMSQGSVKTGRLMASLRTRSYTLPNGFEADFESNSKYNFPTDKGTKDRYTSAGKWTGAVGRSTTDYKGKNKSFKLGFETRAIDQVTPTIEGDLTRDLDRIINGIIERENK